MLDRHLPKPIFGASCDRFGCAPGLQQAVSTQFVCVDVLTLLELFFVVLVFSFVFVMCLLALW